MRSDQLILTDDDALDLARSRAQGVHLTGQSVAARLTVSAGLRDLRAARQVTSSTSSASGYSDCVHSRARTCGQRRARRQLFRRCQIRRCRLARRGGQVSMMRVT